jgi:hypothetical protein
VITAERWSNWACNNGVKRGAVRVVSGTYSEMVDASDACDLVIQHDARSTVALGEVLRLTDDAGVVREYRVQARGRALSSQQRTVRGLSPWADLGRAGRVRTTSGGLVVFDVGGVLTLEEFLTDIVLTNLAADGLSWLTLGTIATTEPKELVAPGEGWSHIEWITQLCTLFGVERRLRRVSDTSYALDCPVTIGAGAAAVRVALGRNLLDWQEDADDSELATAITVLGATPDGAVTPATIGENAYVLGTIPGSAPYWIPLTDFAGGAAPIVLDDQWLNAYLLTKTGTTVQITDSRASDSAVLVSATAGLTAGDLVQIVKDTSATRLTEVTAPNTRRLHRVDMASTLRGERNLARNGTFESFSGLVPDHWVVGGSVAPKKYPRTSSTTFTLTGGNGGVSGTSVTITAGPANHVVYEGEVLQFPGTASRVVASTVQLDVSGAGTITLTAAIAVTNGSSITDWGTAFTNRRNIVLPDDGLSTSGNVLWVPETNDGLYGATSGWATFVPAAASAIRSPTYTVKYIAGLPYLHAAVGWSVRCDSAYGIYNRDGSTVETADVALTAHRQLPALVLGKVSTSTLLASVLHTTKILASTNVHVNQQCSALLSADTDVALQFYGCSAYTVGPGRYYHPTLLRWAMLWLAPNADAAIPPLCGDRPHANELVARGNRGLLARGSDLTQLRVTAADLSAAAGYSVTREQVTLGGPIEVADLGVTVRAMGILMNAEGGTDYLLDSRPTALTQFLAERV